MHKSPYSKYRIECTHSHLAIIALYSITIHCHLYKLCKDAEGNYTVMELYEDEAAMAAHGESEHFKASGAGFKGLMGGAPEIIRMEVVG